MKLEISAFTGLISAPNRNLVCKAFKTAPTWQEAAHLTAAGAQLRVLGLCCVTGAKDGRSLGARQGCAVCQLGAGAGEGDTEQRAAPQQPLWLLCQRASWEGLTLQRVSAAVSAVPEPFPEDGL